MKEQCDYYEAKLRYEIDAWDLHEALKSEEAPIVIDTRSPEAYAAEHIPGALNIPHRRMGPERMDQLERNRLYVTYCDGIGCNASTKGALKMAKLGFQVRELLGGLDWWKRDGHPTEGERSVPPASEGEACGC